MTLNETQKRKYNSIVLTRSGVTMLIVGGYSASQAGSSPAIAPIAFVVGIGLLFWGRQLMLEHVASLEKRVNDLEQPSKEPEIIRRDSVPSGGAVENGDANDDENDGAIL